MKNQVVHADGDSMIKVREMELLNVDLTRQIFRILSRTLRIQIASISVDVLRAQKLL